MEGDKPVLVRDLERKTGLNWATIRFYEKCAPTGTGAEKRPPLSQRIKRNKIKILLRSKRICAII